MLSSAGAREKRNADGFLPSDLARRFKYNTMLNELERGDHAQIEQPRARDTPPITPRSTDTRRNSNQSNRPKSASSSRERAPSSVNAPNSPTGQRSRPGSAKSTRSSASVASVRSSGTRGSKHSLLDDF